MKKVTKESLKSGQTIYVVWNGNIDTFRVRSKAYRTESGYWVCDTPDSFSGRVYLTDAGIVGENMFARKAFFSRKKAQSYLKSYKHTQQEILRVWQQKIKNTCTKFMYH